MRSTATATTSTRHSACRASASSAGWATNWWWRPTRRRSPRWSTRRAPRRTSAAWRARELEGPYGFYEAVDYTHRAAAVSDEAARAVRNTGPQGTVVRSFLAHHQGMTLVSLANTLLDDVMVRRFHADPRVQATDTAAAGARARVMRRSPSLAPPRPRGSPPPVPAVALRRFRSPHTRYPHAQFLSNGAYVTVVTNAGGGASLCRGQGGDALSRGCDARPGQPVPVPARRAQRLRLVGDIPADARASRRSTSSRSRPSASCSGAKDDDIATQLDIAVSTEDDVEVRRLSVTNLSDRPRELEITSYGEIALAALTDDLAHPAFGKLFIETEYLPESAALICAPPPALARGRGHVGGARAQHRGADAGTGGVGDRPAPLPRAGSRSGGSRWRSTDGPSREPRGRCSTRS